MANYIKVPLAVNPPRSFNLGALNGTATDALSALTADNATLADTATVAVTAEKIEIAPNKLVLKMFHSHMMVKGKF